jgi:hypothetical protein
MSRVGQNRICTHVHTVYDRMHCDCDFPAKYTVYTSSIHMVLANPSYEQ